MKLKLLTVALFASMVLSACSGKTSDETVKVKDTSNIKELVSDYSTRNKKAENASITSQQLIVTEKDGSKTEYDLPKKEFFVSIAPYAIKTHP